MNEELPLQKINKNVERGTFRAWVARNYGWKGFEENGNIRPEITNKVASGRCPVCGLPSGKCICPDKLTVKRAVLARTFRRITVGQKEFKV